MDENVGVKLYEQIVNYITKQIANGEYKVGDRLPTEMYFANMFNVSRITSKRALDELEHLGLIYRKQGSGSYVAERTPKQADYSEYDSNSVSFIFPYSILDGRFIELVQNMTQVFEDNGYHLILHNKGEHSQNDREQLDLARKNGAKGIVIYPSSDTANIDLLYEMCLNRFPIVTIDKKLTDLPISSICSDNYNGAYELTNYFIRKGHRKIACFYLVNLHNISSVRKRYYGYCNALVDNGLEFNFDLVVNNFHRNTKGSSAEERIAKIGDAVVKLVANGVTAICAENDYVAFELLNACAQKGISVPNDLSIVGFDNLTQCELSSPKLTSASQDFESLGRVAAEALLKKINDPKVADEDFVIPVKLCERDSVKDLN